MAFRVAATAFFLCSSFRVAFSKIYDRCELAHELRDVHDIPEHQLATWMCITNYESHWNTSAHNPKSGDHGLFQISELYWCSPPGVGLSCGLNCASLEDEDIEDDVICAKRIYRQHQRMSGDGFTAWVVYNMYCRNPVHVAAFLDGCFDYENSVKYGYQPDYAAMNLPTVMVPMPTKAPSKSSATMSPASPSVQSATPKLPMKSTDKASTPESTSKPPPKVVTGKPQMKPSASAKPSKASNGSSPTTPKPAMMTSTSKPSHMQVSEAAHVSSPVTPKPSPKPSAPEVIHMPSPATPKPALKSSTPEVIQMSSPATPKPALKSSAPEVIQMSSPATPKPAFKSSTPEVIHMSSPATPKPALKSSAPEVIQMSSPATSKPALKSSAPEVIHMSSPATPKPSPKPSPEAIRMSSPGTPKPQMKVSTYKPHFSTVAAKMQHVPETHIINIKPISSMGVATYKPNYRNFPASRFIPIPEQMIKVAIVYEPIQYYTPARHSSPPRTSTYKPQTSPPMVSVKSSTPQVKNVPSTVKASFGSATPKPQKGTFGHNPFLNPFASMFQTPKSTIPKPTPYQVLRTTQRPSSPRRSGPSSVTRSPVSTYSPTTPKPGRTNPIKPRQTKNTFKFRPDEKVYAVINDSGYSYAISSRGFKLVWTGQ